MAIKFDIEKHAYAFPTKVLAGNGGEHILNIELTDATDNGVVMEVGAYLEGVPFARQVVEHEEPVVVSFHLKVRHIQASRPCALGHKERAFDFTVIAFSCLAHAKARKGYK